VTLQVQPDQRDHAKTMSYGLLFGMGAAKLAKDMQVHCQAAAMLARVMSVLVCHCSR